MIKTLFSISTLFLSFACEAQLPEGFVYLHDVVPTIQVDLRYAETNNFLGRKVFGYQNINQSKAILTKQAALALKKAQEIFNQDGFSIVLYDAYRPQKAVDDFIYWAKNTSDQKMKKQFYPRVNKARVFELGYIVEKSGHSRGSTVDISLIELGKKLQPIKISYRKFKGIEFAYYDDGTIDMGTSFDLFDEASHFDNTLVIGEYKIRRAYLKDVMDQSGFEPYAEEWWHFSLKDEPFPDKYFNFEMK